MGSSTPSQATPLVLPSAMLQAGSTEAPLAAKPAKIPGAVRNAGIYHVASGTWTRNGGTTANFGPDTIYANTVASGYFSSVGLAGGFAPGGTVIDEGALPTSLNTRYPNANRDSYNVNCVSISYCDLGAPASGGWALTFYEAYQPCTSNTAPTATVMATSLPAGGCWTLALDLAGGSEFCLAGNGGGLNGPLPTSFGWGTQYIGTDGTAAAGFILAGDPMSTDPSYVAGGLPIDGTNTYYGPASLCTGGATGLLTEDSFWVEDSLGMATGCYWFGGYSNVNGCGTPFNPYSSFFLELQADTSLCGTAPGPYEYCQSNPNSTGVHSTIRFAGSASVAADAIVMTASLPPLSFGFFVTSPTQGFSMNPAGSAGNVCLGGNLGRFVGPGQIKNSGPAGKISLSTLAGEWSLTAIPGATGPYAAVAGMQSNFQLWHRDFVGTMATSNLTDGYSITWTP